MNCIGIHSVVDWSRFVEPSALVVIIDGNLIWTGTVVLSLVGTWVEVEIMEFR